MTIKIQALIEVKNQLIYIGKCNLNLIIIIAGNILDVCYSIMQL